MNKSIKILGIAAFLAIFCSLSFETRAQGFEPRPGMTQLNFGTGATSLGIPIYVGLDFGITDKITIGPRASFRHYSYGRVGVDYGYSIFSIMFRGDYHFGGHISGLPRELDLYGGLTAGYSAWGDNDDNPYDNYGSGPLFHAQAGGRWYFTRNWAANAEIAVGQYSDRGISGLEVGLSYMF